MQNELPIPPKFKLNWVMLIVVGCVFWLLFLNGLDVVTTGGVRLQATVGAVTYPSASISATISAIQAEKPQLLVTKPVPTEMSLQIPVIVPTRVIVPFDPNTDANMAATAAAASDIAYRATAAAAEPGGSGEGAVTCGGHLGPCANSIIPTSMPIPTPFSNDSQGQAGSKPVNIQETHTCLHAQIWVDGRGCRNPTRVPEATP